MMREFIRRAPNPINFSLYASEKEADNGSIRIEAPCATIVTSADAAGTDLRTVIICAHAARSPFLPPRSGEYEMSRVPRDHDHDR